MSSADTFLARWADITAIGSAAAVLSWDQETKMPAGGQAGRGQTLSVLAGLQHDHLTDPALAEAIDRASDAAGDDPVLDAQVRMARRDVVRASAVPGDLARRMAEVRSRALGVWQQARADADFSSFAPVLTDVVEMSKEQADALVAAGIAEHRYDALLDEYEPGATEAQLVTLLGDLRDQLSPLVKAVTDSGVVIDESPATGSFAEAAQLELGTVVAGALGYDFESGRLDLSAHPFTTGFDPGDVRITWRPEPDDFRPGLFGIMHEAGHAMYEQGLPTELARTPLGAAVSLGIHESQSRLWENQVGRSRAFWEWALPRFQQAFPGTDSVTVEALFPALHTVTPSLIRVEADEATYNLHIVARFEIERQLIAGSVEVADLPDLWNDTYDELLGVRPTSVTDGVLQDIHWAMGAIGYFPTYAIGNLVAAQLFDAATGAIDDLPGRIASGDFAPLLEWLRDNVHRHGRALSADELVERATGVPLSSAPFLDYLRTTTADVYGIRL
ncbi:carboxypeptidase M32 [Ilumatobacter sp.]|uniref:carboxypeptidase M32 n=1 Tax=Ilumatobacter sp. TaxID=1967498 RepID=UPI003C572607